MKTAIRNYLYSTVIALGVAVSGCATNGTSPLNTPAQVAAQVCPLVQPTLVMVSTIVIDPKTQLELAAASTAVNLVCSAGATVNTANLQSMVNTALPVIITAVKASTLPLAQQNAISMDLTLANTLINALVISTGTKIIPAASLYKGD